MGQGTRRWVILCRCIRRVGMAAAWALVVVPAVWAQGTQLGMLAGGTQTADGEALPGVTVTASSPSLQGERVTVTGTNGDYVLRALPLGSYKVRFALEGMTTVDVAVVVELGRTTRADAVLELAALEESIEVVGEAPPILDSSSVGANYDADTVDSLAIARDLESIAALAPGVSEFAVLDQLSISGSIGYDNLMMVDGVDIGFSIFGNTNGPFQEEVGLYLEEAVDETQILTGAISAEYGRFSGGVVNAVTKRGGNQFRGSVRADLTNPGWRDETAIEKESGISGTDTQNELFSATLGGYILRDHLWFFVAGAHTSRSDQAFLPVVNETLPSTFDNQRLQLKLTGSFKERHTVEVVALDNDSDASGTVTEGLTIDPRMFDEWSMPHEYQVGRYVGVLGSILVVEAQYSRRDFLLENLGSSSTDIRDSPFYDNTDYIYIYNAPYFDEADPSFDIEDEQIAANISYFLATDRAGSHDLELGLEQFTATQHGGLSQSSTEFVMYANWVVDVEGNPVFDDQGRYQPIWGTFEVFADNYIPDRDARLDIETTSLYVNDFWRLGNHWSFNVGFRYEDVSGDASSAGSVVSTGQLMPRLSAAYDPLGNGKYRIGAGYAEYSGRYNTELFKKTSTSRNFTWVGYIYAGPPGVGIDFDPGWDLDNYFAYAAEDPTANVFFESGLSSPVSEEITLSLGMQLQRGGFLELSYVDRQLTDVVEDFVTIDNGTTVADLPSGPLELDNIVYRNTGLARREYKAVQLQGRYRITDRWSLDGHWTWQLENDGNFEGDNQFNPALGSAIGDYPEILAAERSYPGGRLDEFQQHKVRLWTTYMLPLGRAGDLTATLLYRYDSPRTYSLTAFAPLSDTQRARDPGYALPPSFQNIFFGERGSGEFNRAHVFDLAATYTIPVWKMEPWIKFEVRNLFNDDTVLRYSTSVRPDFAGPVDQHGIPTQFFENPGFGQPTSPDDYVTPREYLFSLGMRF